MLRMGNTSFTEMVMKELKMEANVEKLVCEGSMAMARKLRSYHIVTSVLPSENYYLGWWKSGRVGKSNC